MDIERSTKRNAEARTILDTMMSEGRISKEEFQSMKSALEDAEWSVCKNPRIDVYSSGDALGHVIEDAFNGSIWGEEMRKLGDWLCRRTHRYLQSEIFKFVLKYIKTYADMWDKNRNMYFDSRNEWVGQRASEIAAASSEIFKYETSLIETVER